MSSSIAFPTVGLGLGPYGGPGGGGAVSYDRGTPVHPKEVRKLREELSALKAFTRIPTG